METLLYFLIWAALIAVMLRYGCGAHIMGHGHRTQKAEAVDPVCGMTVPTATAKSSMYDGRAYYFCSQDCREKFEASPKSYLKGGSTFAARTMEARHDHGH
jgi:YHS domain-containing protein